MLRLTANRPFSRSDRAEGAVTPGFLSVLEELSHGSDVFLEFVRIGKLFDEIA